jgi:hypothetical protein
MTSLASSLRREILTALAVALAVVHTGCSAQQRASESALAQANYVFAYFTGTGKSGMHLAVSDDGLVFTPLQRRPVLRSSLSDGLIRDPSIILGPDGNYHCVWTTGWWSHGFGIAHSPDLLRWSRPEFVPVMADIEGAVNTWAPEIHWDPDRFEYLVLWASTVRGRFEETDGSSEPGPDGRGLNHRIWCATTRDFRQWTPASVFYDGGFNAIDAVVVHDGQAAGARRPAWVMVLKDETLLPAPQKCLRIARAERLQGPYSAAGDPISAPGVWVEGPTLARLDVAPGSGADGAEGGGGGEGEWIMYFDCYTLSRFGALRSTDLQAWDDVSSAVSMPPRARHGCIIRLPSTPHAQRVQLTPQLAGSCPFLFARALPHWRAARGRCAGLGGVFLPPARPPPNPQPRRR